MGQDLSGIITFSLPNQSHWFSGKLHAPENSDKRVTVAGFTGDSIEFGFSVQNKLDWSELKSIQTPISNMPSSQYSSLVSQAVLACSSELEKVVLSRKVEMDVKSVLIPIWLKRLKEAFPNAFVYCLQSPSIGCWMGATPEILAKKSGDFFETMSLAGTKWDHEAFSDKEYLEQRIVTETILDDLGLTPEATGEIEEMGFGSIRHLQTKIQWKSSETLGDVSQKLHPTPAICGLPKTLALEYILANEGYHRELYTGYIQIEGFDQYDYSFVNLRCMQVFSHRLCFYVGGGINAMSVPQSEWIETEKKLATILNALDLGN